MRFPWIKIAEFLRLPDPYEHLDGWAFDGKRVFADTFVQRSGPPDGEIPPAGSDWWWSYLVGKSFRRDWIFDNRREAVEYALEYLDKRIERFQGIRERVVHEWKGHLKVADA